MRNIMSNKSSLLFRLKQTGLGLSIAKKISLFSNKLAPNWAYRKVEDLFLTPNGRKIIKNKIPHGIKPFQIDTKKGALQGYQLGRGPTVILVHGWSGGAYQFFPLMRL